MILSDFLSIFAIGISVFAVFFSAFLSHYSSKKITKESHQMQLRAYKTEEYKNMFLDFKDSVQFAQQKVQYKYNNLESFNNRDELIFEDSEVFNRIINLGTKLNSMTVLHGKLYNIDIFLPEDIYNYHSAIVDLMFELQRLKSTDEKLTDAKLRLQPFYEDMMRITGYAAESMLNYTRKIEKVYHQDIK